MSARHSPRRMKAVAQLSAAKIAFGDTICKSEGENCIVCPNLKRSLTRSYGSLAFVNLETLVERLKL